jgi:kinesin family member 21
LQEDINVKEQLIIQLELSQRRLDQLRQDYERKLGELGQRILATEAERDQILEQMTTSKDPKQTKQQEDDIKKVREKYEKRLADMRTEHRRLELAERENKKNLVQQNKQQSELGRIRQEMENMKRQKVGNLRNVNLVY